MTRIWWITGVGLVLAVLAVLFGLFGYDIVRGMKVEKLDPKGPVPVEMTACEANGDCIMAGKEQAENYGSRSCACINKVHSDEFQEGCDLALACRCENQCVCKNGTCTLVENVIGK